MDEGKCYERNRVFYNTLELIKWVGISQVEISQGRGKDFPGRSLMGGNFPGESFPGGNFPKTMIYIQQGQGHSRWQTRIINLKKLTIHRVEPMELRSWIYIYHCLYNEWSGSSRLKQTYIFWYITIFF